VAEFLRQQGTGVAFVTRHGSMGHLLEGAMMVDAAHERLLGPGFSLHTRMRVAEVRHAGVVLESLDTGSQETVPADLVVFVSGNDAHDPVSAAARARGIEVRAAGDALSARYLQAAIHEGRAAGMAV
jgi:NADH dehydrogenase FAD-containing subunit